MSGTNPFRAPIVGMQPRAFVCSGCGNEVREERHGQGFKNCGQLQHAASDMLCAECLDVARRVIALAARHREAIRLFLDQLEP
jgi:hypothetical protein